MSRHHSPCDLNIQQHRSGNFKSRIVSDLRVFSTAQNCSILSLPFGIVQHRSKLFSTIKYRSAAVSNVTWSLVMDQSWLVFKKQNSRQSVRSLVGPGTTGMLTMHSVTQYSDFTKASFASWMSHNFVVHVYVQLHLSPYEMPCGYFHITHTCSTDRSAE